MGVKGTLFGESRTLGRGEGNNRLGQGGASREGLI